MFKQRRQWWWIVGTCIALLGVALVRLLAPEYPPETTRMVIKAVGYSVVIVGLFTIPLAMREDE